MRPDNNQSFKIHEKKLFLATIILAAATGMSLYGTISEGDDKFSPSIMLLTYNLGLYALGSAVKSYVVSRHTEDQLRSRNTLFDTNNTDVFNHAIALFGVATYSLIEAYRNSIYAASVDERPIMGRVLLSATLVLFSAIAGIFGYAASENESRPAMGHR